MKTTLLSLKAFFTICLLCLVGGVNVMAQDTETVDFTKQGYTQDQDITEYQGKDFKIAFSNGTNTTHPRFIVETYVFIKIILLPLALQKK